MHHFYIARHATSIIRGVWGVGPSKHQAMKNLRAQLGAAERRKLKPSNVKLDFFQSTRPFAPSKREATEDEADAYVDTTDGRLCWIRCDRVELDPAHENNQWLFDSRTWRKHRVKKKDPA